MLGAAAGGWSEEFAPRLSHCREAQAGSVGVLPGHRTRQIYERKIMKISRRTPAIAALAVVALAAAGCSSSGSSSSSTGGAGSSSPAGASGSTVDVYSSLPL